MFSKNNIKYFTILLIFYRKKHYMKKNDKKPERRDGLVRDLNPGPLAPKARIIPLDQRADVGEVEKVNNLRELYTSLTK